MNPEHRERPPEFTVRLATPGDADRIAEIQYDSWLETYPSEELDLTVEDLRKQLDDLEMRKEGWRQKIEVLPRDCRIFVLEENGRVQGFCRVSKFSNENHIDALYLDPAIKGVGAGGKVFQESLEWLGDEQDISLEVAEHNTHAIGFYERYDFQVMGKDKVVPVGQKSMPLLRMVRKAQVQ